VREREREKERERETERSETEGMDATQLIFGKYNDVCACE
jgi:hypothetical protein